MGDKIIFLLLYECGGVIFVQAHLSSLLLANLA